MGTDAKPLFIPLKREFYFAFLDGSKEWEFRLYGSRWNEHKCHLGRAVTLSNGYGKHNRSVGHVAGFKAVPFEALPGRIRLALYSCYGDEVEGKKIAAIRIGGVRRQPHHITIDLTFHT